MIFNNIRIKYNLSKYELADENIHKWSLHLRLHFYLQQHLHTSERKWNANFKRKYIVNAIVNVITQMYT